MPIFAACIAGLASVLVTGFTFFFTNNAISKLDKSIKRLESLTVQSVNAGDTVVVHRKH